MPNIAVIVPVYKAEASLRRCVDSILSQTYPNLKERIFGAMQRYPLPEWEPHGRYKRPKEQ